MNKKKLITLMLVAAMLLPTVGCASNNDSDGNDTQGGASSDTTVADSAETEIADNLPDKDLTGFTYRMWGYGTDIIKQFYVDELDGNIVNDAVYNKIATVEERFGCDIVLSANSTPETNDSTDEIKNVIMSGDDSFDIVQGHDINMGTLSLEGYFVNLKDVPYLDFEKPWWPKNTVDSLTVNDQMYLMANNIGYFSIAATRVMFFNKTIAENHNLGSLYQYVYDGTWTLDKMTEIMKGVSTDLDGNSTLDENDQFGLVNPGYYYCWLEPFDVETYKEDNNGELYYDFQLDKMTSLVEKFYNILFGGEGFNTSYDNATDMFSQNRALFMYDTLETATKIFSLTDVVYGVLPMPKFDENQKEYMGGFTDRPMAIPITVANNLENIGIVTEALNMEGYKQVFPAYYELALKSRYADQSDDAAMIDIIHDNSVMAFTYLYGNHASAYSNMLGTLFSGNSPSTDVASYAAKNEKAQTKYLEKLNEFFSENE